jgi:hypothetical protein
MSFLGSFIKLVQSQSIKKATFAGCPWESWAGSEILCFRWSEKSNSSPPLESRELGRACMEQVQGKTLT